ncbi:MAG: hypothetical protein NTW14_10150 [bacterium]|nr:hypothetical protein [bacterium]
MSAVPVWLWGTIGGIILGPIGLAILWPGCARGAQSLLNRFILSSILKLIIAGAGLIIGVKALHFDPKPLAIGFLVGYILSLFVEVIPCIWKLRQCSKNPPSAG